MGEPVYFGVRHLSPAAAFHLRKALDAARPEQVLVEGLSKRDPGMVSGKGTRNITVTFKGTSEDIGKIIPVHITSAAVNTLRGERAER